MKKGIILLFSIFLLLLLCLFGPRGGLQNEVSKNLGTNIVFVLDVSKSMNALDFLEGRLSRLDMAKTFISDFINSHSENNYALDIFSGDAIQILPFTSDISLYQTFLSGLDESNIGKTGTDMEKALDNSISHFTENIQGGVIVFFTDGGDEEIGDISFSKKLSKKQSVEIIIVGIGNTKGSYIPVGNDFFGNIIYKTYKGERVITKLNSGGLKKISSDIGGDYLSFTEAKDGKGLYDLISSQSQDILLERDIEKRKDLTGVIGAFAFLLWIGFLFLLLLSKFPRKN